MNYKVRFSYGDDCFFMLPNGEYVIAEYNQERITTHFEYFLSKGITFDPTLIDEWAKKQKEYQLVRLVPECKVLLLSKDQKLTKEQEQRILTLLYYYDYNKEYYEF